MRKLNLKMLFLGLLSLSSMNSLQAVLRPEPGCYGLQLEYLYLHPSIDDTYYVNVGTYNPTGGSATVFVVETDNDPTFGSGVRVAGAYGYCDGLDLCARFMYFNHNHHRSVSSPPNTGPGRSGTQTPLAEQFLNNLGVNLFESASGPSDSTTDFKCYDGEFGLDKNLFCSDAFNFAVFAGLRTSYLKFKELDSIIDTESPFLFVDTYKSQFWGIGPDIGLNMDYDFLCCGNGTLTFIADARAALLIGRKNNDHSTIVTSAGITPLAANIGSENIWHVNPAFDFRLGLNYTLPCRCMVFNLECGYEALWYHNVFDKSILNTVTDMAGAVIKAQSLSLHGPYIALGVIF